ncbi:MAG: IS1595 family transposase [Solirubrobacteraceae bacterium]|jgi:transposase-like protein
MSQKLSILNLADKLRTEADAYLYLEELRWGDRPFCPHCGSVRKPYFLNPENGASRKTRTGSASQRRVWKCADCRKQFSVLTGTVMHGTKIPVRTWVFVMFEMASNRNGMSAREIQRKYDVTAEAAWFMAHRLREAMKRDPVAGLLTGRVVADETWYGGRHKNRHVRDRRPRGKGVTDKTPIMSLVSRETGEVRSRVVNDVKPGNLRSVLTEHVDPKATHLHTDTSGPYIALGPEFASHHAVNHKIGEYVRGDVSTNQAESYFAQLKRSLDGTHHHVSRIHLHRYVTEFDFRWTTCKMADSERMAKIIGGTAGRRLTYRKPTRGD